LTQLMYDHRQALPSDLSKNFSKESEPRVYDQLQELFKIAKGAVEVCPQLEEGTELALYGLFKQTTFGAPTMPKPSSLDPEALQRWTAWLRVSKLTHTQAMLGYCDRVLELFLNENAGIAQKNVEALLFADAHHVQAWEYERFKMTMDLPMRRSFPPVFGETCRNQGLLTLGAKDWELLVGLAQINDNGSCPGAPSCLQRCTMGEEAMARWEAWRMVGTMDKAVARSTFVQASRAILEKNSNWKNRFFDEPKNRFWEWGLYTGNGKDMRINCNPKYVEEAHRANIS